MKFHTAGYKQPRKPVGHIAVRIAAIDVLRNRNRGAAVVFFNFYILEFWMNRELFKPLKVLSCEWMITGVIFWVEK